MSKMVLDLERIVFIGRTFEEYMAMFSLSLEEIEGKKILDCPAGACSFTAIGGEKGLDVTACDIAYYHSGEALANKGKKDLEHATERVVKAKEQYVFDYFKDVSDLAQHRAGALTDCAADMQKNPERYIPVTLPVLPFKNEQFDLILSAHFLFTYGYRLDKTFHLDVMEELLRVAKEEIRIFPLVDLTGNRYEHLDEIAKMLRDQGLEVEEIRVPYEFQRNANTMMKIRKGTN
ncbi:class I SAM-dependent methyltransferase [Domibacillus epiphyticus]|uniref:SAM-dependent methyltransferase n=1 Tax=Domibacillus epiphyticus TaxID=1714355 RepID=A0A1V2ABH6_9BACI|nr:SAM-dependent methyltransferase [Domibacillus epiphyticus]OMP68317.1 SAM-dependent methyltransferase [Domibacillus epiphyticus]